PRTCRPAGEPRAPLGTVAVGAPGRKGAAFVAFTRGTGLAVETALAILAERAGAALALTLRARVGAAFAAGGVVAAGKGAALVALALAHPRLAFGACALGRVGPGRAVGAQPHVARGARGAGPARGVVLALGLAGVKPAQLVAQDAALDLAHFVHLKPGQLERAVADADQPVHLQP